MELPPAEEEEEEEEEEEIDLDSDPEEEEGNKVWEGDLASGSEQEEGSGEEEDNSEDEGSEDEEEDEEEEGEDDEGVRAAPVAGRYVPPALRAAAAGGQPELSAEEQAVTRRIRGLLNRLSEANLQGIVGDLLDLYQEQGRRLVVGTVSSELLNAVADGPRATEQFAAVTAACIAGFTAAADAQELCATFLASLAQRFEAAYLEDNSITYHNLAMVLAFLYSAGESRGRRADRRRLPA